MYSNHGTTETNHTRRSVIRTVAVGAVGGLSSVAGCAGDDGDGEETTTTTGTTTTETTTTSTTTRTPNQEAVEHFENAVDLLVQTKETLEDWASNSFEPSEVSGLQDNVSEAREELSEAEANADPSGELTQSIEQATLVADFQELSLAYYEGVNALFQVISDAKAFGDSEQHERAAEKFANARNITADLRTVIDDMGTSLEVIDNDKLDVPELAYSGEPLDHLDLEARAAIDAVDRYLEGYEAINRSFVHFENGVNAYENESYTEARTQWEQANEKADEAISKFEKAIDNQHLPQSQREESIQLIGTSETVSEAYDKFVEGASEAEDGNIETADGLVNEGFQLLGEI